MYLFVLKKFLFDAWDNLMTVVLMNFYFLMSLAIGFLPIFLYLGEKMDANGKAVFGIKAAAEAPPYTLLIGFWILSAAVLVLLTAVASRYTKDLADYKKPQRKNFFPYLKQNWLSSLIFFGITILIALIGWSSQSFYGRIGGMGGQLGQGAVMALLVFFLLSFQFYFAYRNETGEGWIKSLKGTFQFFLRNPVFCLFTLIVGALLFSVSGFSFLLVPGPFGVMLFFQVAYRQWKKKETYLAEHPEENSRKLKAKKVFADDIELQGARNFKTMFQPWKS